MSLPLKPITRSTLVAERATRIARAVTRESVAKRTETAAAMAGAALVGTYSMRVDFQVASTDGLLFGHVGIHATWMRLVRSGATLIDSRA